MRFSTGQLRDFVEDRPSGVKSEHLKGTGEKTKQINKRPMISLKMPSRLRLG